MAAKTSKRTPVLSHYAAPGSAGRCDFQAWQQRVSLKTWPPTVQDMVRCYATIPPGVYRRNLEIAEVRQFGGATVGVPVHRDK